MALSIQTTTPREEQSDGSQHRTPLSNSSGNLSANSSPLLSPTITRVTYAVPKQIFAQSVQGETIITSGRFNSLSVPSPVRISRSVPWSTPKGSNRSPILIPLPILQGKVPPLDLVLSTPNAGSSQETSPTVNTPSPDSENPSAASPKKGCSARFKFKRTIVVGVGNTAKQESGQAPILDEFKRSIIPGKSGEEKAALPSQVGGERRTPSPEREDGDPRSPKASVDRAVTVLSSQQPVAGTAVVYSMTNPEGAALRTAELVVDSHRFGRALAAWRASEPPTESSSLSKRTKLIIIAVLVVVVVGGILYVSLR